MSYFYRKCQNLSKKERILGANNAQKEQGRSMVEMLGVLAIIGVLSIGAISGYQLAMVMFRTNELINDISLRKHDVQFQLSKKDSETATLEEWDEIGKSGFKFSELEIDHDEYVFSFTVFDVPTKICNGVLKQYWEVAAEIDVGDVPAHLSATCTASLNDMTFTFPFDDGFEIERGENGCPEDLPHFDEESNSCVLCPDITPYWNGSECVACPSNQYYNAVSRKCVCPADRPHWDGSECISCPPGQIYNPILAICACPETAPIWNGTECLACTEPKIYNEETHSCTCPPEKPIEDGDDCVECKSNDDCTEKGDNYYCYIPMNSGHDATAPHKGECRKDTYNFKPIKLDIEVEGKKYYIACAAQHNYYSSHNLCLIKGWRLLDKEDYINLPKGYTPLGVQLVKKTRGTVNEKNKHIWTTSPTTECMIHTDDTGRCFATTPYSSQVWEDNVECSGHNVYMICEESVTGH